MARSFWFNKNFDVQLHIDPKIEFSTVRLWLLVVVSLPYLLWEIYWAHKVGYRAIKWHTHIALYFYGWLGFYLLLCAINGFMQWMHYIKLQIILLSVFIALALAEVVLILFGVGETYGERIDTGYFSMYDSKSESYYRLHKPNEIFYIARPEFKYVRYCNSMGYSDREWPLAKKKNEKRVLCVGDSFTEGVGAPADSCYVSILRTLLDSNYTVMNAGISGDDPCVNYVNYRDRLTSFKPDVIVQTLSSNDLNTDIATKGGMERFKADGIVQLASAPWWEPLFAISYVSRTFFHALGYNDLLLRVPFSKSKADELNQKAIVTFAAYAALAQKHNTLLLVILQPNQTELYKRKFDYDIYPIAEKLKAFSNVRVYDLRTFYMQWFSKNMDEIKPCYWPQDGHHNAKGYAVMATGIKQAMDSLFFNINKQ